MISFPLRSNTSNWLTACNSWMSTFSFSLL
uniref:Uncharacterized protein n=1 Tax=Rhizophora mucronata TaxID=61149 RepID=A0A2P2K181_RHIMU